MLLHTLPKVPTTRTMVVVVLIVATLVVTGTAVVIVGGSSGQRAANPRPSGSVQGTVTDPGSTATRGEVTETSDADALAVSVATALFAWDTTDPTPLDDYTNRLLEVADPTGEETPGLVTDLTTYLPSPESWADLRTYRTRQWIDIDSYEVPSDWESAELDGETADLAAGTTAYTIKGLRRRSGIWQGETAQTVDEVAFTIFMTCQPTYDTCRLLRLSQLNNPLR